MICLQKSLATIMKKIFYQSSAIFEPNMNVPARPERVSEQNQNKHKALTTSELKDCLMWLKTPERQTKVEVEKLFFVITSSG